MERVPVGDRGDFCFWRSFFFSLCGFFSFFFFFLEDKGTISIPWEAEKERSDVNRRKGGLSSIKASVKVKRNNLVFIGLLVAKSRIKKRLVKYSGILASASV